ncbi:hypothetical protein P389DRAFT_39149 [Cystobasidium minutum MCA 4210]|uniref:uncharacterized protein n=1 Tax=Cystobasidium minutum MCA 4210 TaxID=1397322 RepID=UPI0034CE649A|eukprot:jgi/Rhomi1/39149/CE39148_35
MASYSTGVVSLSEYTGYVSFPWSADIHGEDSNPSACWPLPKGAKHRRGCPSVSSFESLSTYVSNKTPSTKKGQISVLKQHTPREAKLDAAGHLLKILEKDIKARTPLKARFSLMKDTLPAFTVTVKTSFRAALPFLREPEALPSGYSNLLYLWPEAFEED